MEPITLLSTEAHGSEIAARIRAVSANILARLIGAAVEDMRARYDLGKIAHELRYHCNGPLPVHALEDLACAFGLKACTLRRYARVSEAIRSSEFEELLALRNRYGLPLTWSHLEELAEVRSSTLRKQFAEAAISEALSVRDLATHVRRQSGVVAKPY